MSLYVSDENTTFAIHSRSVGDQSTNRNGITRHR